ncbi:hypothetical protein BH09ACT10_BH09ACT10_03680 [soil metagenome]
MKISRTAALLALATAAALTVGGASLAVSASKKDVKVCVTSKGVVRSASASGKCPKKTIKKTIVAPPVSTRTALDPVAYAGTSGSGQEVQSSYAVCPAGTVVTGGGHDTDVSDFIAYAGQSGNGYYVISVNADEFFTSYIQAEAICLSMGAVQSAAAGSTAGLNSASERSTKLSEVRVQVAERLTK